MIRILASDGMQADAVKALEAKGFEVTQQFYEPDQLAQEVKNYDVMVVRSATKVRQPIIDAALETGRLKLVIRGGVSVDNIDCAYACLLYTSITSDHAGSVLASASRLWRKLSSCSKKYSIWPI